MRSSTPFYGPYTLARALAPVCAALLAVSGCSISASGISASGIAAGTKYDPYTLYLTTPAPVRVRAELRDRYACAAEVPLVCECMSRFSDCDCRC